MSAPPKRGRKGSRAPASKGARVPSSPQGNLPSEAAPFFPDIPLSDRETYESFVNGGATGSFDELATKHKDITTINGLVLDVDRKVFRPEFTPANFMDYTTTLVPEVEVRKTSPEGNLHEVIRYKVAANDTKKTKRLHARLKLALLADPNQSLLTCKARVVGSKTSYGNYKVELLKAGTPFSTKNLACEFGSKKLVKVMLDALLVTLPAKDGKPCWDGEASHCACPIHGSGANRKQAQVGAEGVTCFADCKGEDAKPKNWTIIDILRARVLNDTEDAKEILERLDKKLKRPTMAPVTSTAGKPIVEFTDGSEEIGSFCAATFKHLKATGIFYDDALQGTVAEVRKTTLGVGRVQLLRHTDETLRTRLPNYIQFRKATREGPRFALLRGEECAVLVSHAGRDALPRLDRLVRTPSYDERLNLLVPGYNPATATYYDGPAVVPVDETGKLSKLLNDFCFHPTDGSRSNLIAVLLATLLFPVVKRNPLLVIGANQPSLGKTLLAKVVGVLADAEIPSTASFTQDEEAMEKRLGVKLRKEARTIVIDNAKAAGRAAISCAPLERMVTDDIATTRHLGYSKDISRVNDLIWVMTLNSPRLSRDLATRALAVNLVYKGDPDERKFTSSPTEVALENRVELLGELVGMVERWKAAGAPRVRALNFRFEVWAAVLGGILQVNGITGFLANRAQAVIEQDAELQDLFALGADKLEKWLLPSDWLADAKASGLLASVLDKSTERGQLTALGILLSRAVGRRVPDEVTAGNVLVLEGSEQLSPDERASVETGRGRKYRVTSIKDAPKEAGPARGEPPGVANLREPPMSQRFADTTAEGTGVSEASANLANLFPESPSGSNGTNAPTSGSSVDPAPPTRATTSTSNKTTSQKEVRKVRKDDVSAGNGEVAFANLGDIGGSQRFAKGRGSQTPGEQPVEPSSADFFEGAS